MPERTRRWVPGRRALRELAWVFALLGWSLFTTWPLAKVVSTRVPQDLGDPLENAWIMAWGAHAVREQPLALFHANIFHPQKFTLAFAENMLGISIPLAPLFWLTENAVLMTNVAALAVTVAGGYGVALLVRSLTRSELAAALAAAAFVAIPYRVVAISHIHVLAIHVLPFLLLALVGLSRRPSWWRAGVVAVLFAIQLWSSLTGGLVTLVGIGCWGVWTLVAHRDTAIRAVAIALVGVATGVLMTSPVLLAYRHARAQNPEYSHPEIEVLTNSATPGAYAYPPSGGSTVRTVYQGLAEEFGGGQSSEETLFPGLVLSCAGLAGLALALVTARFRREAFLAVGIAIAGVIFSFGPRWGGRDDGLLLPFALVSELVPGGLTRVPARFGALVGLSLALVLGLGLATLRRAPQAIAVAVLSVLLVAESWPARQRFVEPPPLTSAHVALSVRDGAVLALPTLEYDASGALVIPSVYREAVHLYLSTGDFRPRTNGYGAFVPTGYATLAQQVQDLPTEEAMSALRRNGVETIVVERALTDQSRWAGVDARLRVWPGVRVLDEEGDTVVFDISSIAR